MLFTLVLGFIAGYAAPMAEPHIRRAMENVTLSKIEVAEGEFDMLSLLVLMAAAAVVAMLLGTGANGIALTLGALAGVFGKRAVSALTSTGARKGDE